MIRSAPPASGTRRRSRPVAARRQARAAVVAEAPVVEFTWANRRPGTDGFARWTAQLGARIDEHGLDAVADDVAKLVATARRHGVALVAAGVLADPAQPEPARHRAFAHVTSALVATQPLGSVTSSGSSSPARN